MPDTGARVLAVCNQKGGVGKSTTAFQLARAATRAGLRVLLVDTDPQGNLTTVAAADPVPADQPGLADALSSRTPDTLTDVLVPTHWDGVDLAPTAGQSLGAVRDELLLAGPGREARLRAGLHQVRDRYDLVLLDCPPSLDQLTINALTAADQVLVVTEARLWSADGLAALLGTVDAVAAHYNPDLGVAGVLLNRHEPRTVGAQHWADQLTQAAHVRGLRLLDPPIPKRTLIADATEAGRGVDQWPGREAAAVADLYAAVLDHLLEEP